MSDVTQILSQIEQGDPTAAKDLLPLVYNELRQLAAQRMAAEKADHTLQATALVHEAYIRLVDNVRAQHWNSRGHFFAAAAEAMRRILVEHARQRQAKKRGGELRQQDIATSLLADRELAVDLLALDEALDGLARRDDQAAALAKLHIFAGMPIESAAAHLGVSERTAARRWAFARAWLIREMN
jgi:RNA polymerase sigma factor (TIGR02999 family)